MDIEAAVEYRSTEVGSRDLLREAVTSWTSAWAPYDWNQIHSQRAKEVHDTVHVVSLLGQKSSEKDGESIWWAKGKIPLKVGFLTHHIDNYNQDWVDHFKGHLFKKSETLAGEHYTQHGALLHLGPCVIHSLHTQEASLDFNPCPQHWIFSFSSILYFLYNIGPNLTCYII